MRAVLYLAVALLCVALVGADRRSDLTSYLQSVYTAVPASTFANLPTSQLERWFNSLSFYYENYPALSDTAREKSMPFDSLRCNCWVKLPGCLPPQSPCASWPLDTYFNMDWLENVKPLPDNSWFEGVTYPGEWGFPYSCTPQGDSFGKQNKWGGSMWLYPTTGTGVFFNTGKTAQQYNKVAWLVENGVGILGATEREVMDAAATICCPNYRNLTGCEDCADPGDPTKCCCHGVGSRNLGSQVIDIKNKNPSWTWDQALDKTIEVHKAGALGNDEDPGSSLYPYGTYFSLRNALDPSIARVMLAKNISTAQFLREPQHIQVDLHPPYAFELLLAQAAPSWTGFCQTPGLLALVDPTNDLDGYISAGAVTPASAAHTAPLSSFKGRVEFQKLFFTSPPTASGSSLWQRVVSWFSNLFSWEK